MNLDSVQAVQLLLFYLGKEEIFYLREKEKKRIKIKQSSAVQVQMLSILLDLSAFCCFCFVRFAGKKAR